MIRPPIGGFSNTVANTKGFIFPEKGIPSMRESILLRIGKYASTVSIFRLVKFPLQESQKTFLALSQWTKELSRGRLDNLLNVFG